MVVILDFGSQLTLLIARRVRELGVYCEIKPFDSSPEALKKLRPGAIILSGGPASVLRRSPPKPRPEVFALGVPILGICYGQQLLAKMLGGELKSGDRGGEFGPARVKIKDECSLYKGIWRQGRDYKVWMSHGDAVAQPPSGFKVTALSKGAAAVIADEKRRFYGVQFHPEVTHTPDGKKILANFLYKIAARKADWNMPNFASQAVADIRKRVGKRRVICAVSGGVDSTVTAVLLQRAVGERFVGVFVDDGLLRKNEAAEVRAFYEKLGINFCFVDAAAEFLSRLKGVAEPEKKRKIIGNVFIKVFQARAKETGADFLAQGTLYPDVIESSSFGGKTTIKSHHNVGGLPKNMPFRLIEPLRLLFKDEVRTLGRQLGISDKWLMRHPFPGPGLAVRLPGAVSESKLRLLREVDAIYLEILEKAGLTSKIWQAFAVLLPVRATAVMGDARRRGFTVALRAVVSADAMTASPYPIPHKILEQAATAIINRCGGVARVLYDITSKPPATIEWE